MHYTPLLQHLIETLRCLPGVGAKSAQRMAFHLLERDRKGALSLAEALAAAMRGIGHCEICRSFSEQTQCALCANPKRDRSQLCVVETPADVVALEQASVYRGLYFVLMGHLSPLDGIGPDELGMDLLQTRMQDEDLREVILATNATVEGEATAHYIMERVQCAGTGLRISRIAHGVPLGGELEYVDGGTLSHAFSARRVFKPTPEF